MSKYDEGNRGRRKSSTIQCWFIANAIVMTLNRYWSIWCHKAIKGTDAVAEIKETYVKKAAGQVSVLTLTHYIIPNAFTYIIMLFSTDKQVDGIDLYELYGNIAELATHLIFPNWIELPRKLEFPFQFGFGAHNLVDFPMSDMLYTLKKLRNNGKYLLTTRVLLFSDPALITSSDWSMRLRWRGGGGSTWETLVLLLEESQIFRVMSVKVQVLWMTAWIHRRLQILCLGSLTLTGVVSLGLLLQTITYMFTAM